MMKKPKVLSALGLAASIALVAVFLSPWSNVPTVQAAVIMEKLSQQIDESPLIEIALESLNIDDAFVVNGRLQISNQGLAGDIEAAVGPDADNPEVGVNISMGLQSDGGWVLIRELKINDPEAQALIEMFLPAEGEVLLLLPEDEETSDLDLDLASELGELGSEKVVGLLKELIDSHDEYGATIEQQPDGTILLTLPIEDEEALAALGRLSDTVHERIQAGQSGDSPPENEQETRREQIEREVHGAMGEHHLDHDAKELIGSTLTVVYDPVAELVRSFGIENLGPTRGRISVTIGEGEIDPALFDSSRVTTPQTRTFDLSALKSMFENLESSND